jgi:hypothetical protein
VQFLIDVVSPQRTLGITEVEAISVVRSGVAALLKRELELSATPAVRR